MKTQKKILARSEKSARHYGIKIVMKRSHILYNTYKQNGRIVMVNSYAKTGTGLFCCDEAKCFWLFILKSWGLWLCPVGDTQLTF